MLYSLHLNILYVLDIGVGEQIQSIFFPLIEPLTKTTRTQDKDYETVGLIHVLEKITSKQFITKRENRLIRRWLNITIQVNAVIPTNEEPLRIASKEGFVEICPSF